MPEFHPATHVPTVSSDFPADAARPSYAAPQVAGERPVIKVTGVVLRRANGDVLTVRKRGTEMFMFPGGKPEPGESAVDTAVREVAEELGLALTPEDLELVGEWHTVAANEPGHALHSHVYASRVALTETPVPASEIVELRWQRVDGVEDVEDLAPLSRWHAIPALRG